MVLLKVIAALLVIQAANAANSGYAEFGQFPFHVSVQKEVKASQYEHICSGALVKENFVLTSANCVYDGVNSTKYAIKAGMLKLSTTTGVQTIKVSKIVPHEDYHPSGPFYNEHDLAILELAEKVKLTNEVKIVELPESKKDYNVSRIATMIGYKFASQYALASLKYFETFIINNEACKEALKQPNFDITLHKSQFCVNDIKNENVYTIKGDSGDTLVQKDDKKTILIGLAASYMPQPTSNGKSIFTQVSLYVDWINKKVGNGAFGLTYGYLVLIATAISVAKNLFY